MRTAIIRSVLTRAALVAVVPAVIAACGQQPQGPSSNAGATQPTGSANASTATSATPAGSGCGAPATPASQGTLTLRADDNGKTLCLRTGTAVLVFLHGSATSRWTPIRVRSAALAPHPNPAFTLPLWVTGGSFLAVHPGTVVITSSRPACGLGPQPSSLAASGGASCPSVRAVFRVTLVITR
jgi:hypothetical protein